MKDGKTLEKYLEQEDQEGQEIGNLSGDEAYHIERAMCFLEKILIPHYKKSLEMLDIIEDIEANSIQIESEKIGGIVNDIFDVRMSGGVSCRQFYYKMIAETYEKIRKLQDILDRYYYPF